jgi:cytochrome c oxidase cbb3-type subunit 2
MSEKNKFFSHATLESNAGWLIVTTIFVVAIAGLVQIVPLFFQHSTTEPSPGVTPYSALRLAGTNSYVAL